jgi:hypothetical protein
LRLLSQGIDRLRRINLPRTPVNKGMKKGQTPRRLKEDICVVRI